MMIRSLLSAFLMYSRIPVPQVEWKEENRRYALGFFPLVGAVIGAMLFAWNCFSGYFGIGRSVFAAVSVIIPVAVTGGIHLDGFCDVTDSLSSFGDKKKRLEIMSDPHIGSFAVIYLCIYLIALTALFAEADSASVKIMCCGYMLSRGLSGLSAVTFRAAKKDGSLRDLSKPSHKKLTAAMDIFFMILSAALSVIISPVQGICAVISAFAVFVYYRARSYREFGGTTGDLCGWFLVLCEIMIFAASFFSGKIMEVILK